MDSFSTIRPPAIAFFAWTAPALNQAVDAGRTAAGSEPADSTSSPPGFGAVPAEAATFSVSAAVGAARLTPPPRGSSTSDRPWDGGINVDAGWVSRLIGGELRNSLGRISPIRRPTPCRPGIFRPPRGV